MIGLNADWKLTTTAYAHQRAAIEKLSRLRVGALFMDMGTGKTRTALELVWLRRKRIAKCVWCCPVSLMEETKREILRHTSCLDTDIHMIGPGRGRRTYHRAGGILSAGKPQQFAPRGLCS